MKLLTNELQRTLPPLGTGDAPEAEPMALVKYFTPDSSWTWYASEFDGDDIFYGVVDGFEVEFGYFSLRELQSVRGHLGLPIERDLYFTPMPLHALYDELQARHRSY